MAEFHPDASGDGDVPVDQPTGKSMQGGRKPAGSHRRKAAARKLAESLGSRMSFLQASMLAGMEGSEPEAMPVSVRGQFKINASMVEANSAEVRLKKSDGRVVAVPVKN